MKTAEKPESYEDQSNPFARRLERVARHAMWRLKGARQRPRDILIETRWRLGDEIMALPIYESIRARFPGDRLHIWTNYPELFAATSHIDSVNRPQRFVDRYIPLRGARRDLYRLEDYAMRAHLPSNQPRPRLDTSAWTSPLLDEMPGSGPIVAIAPGASWATKRWPTRSWQDLVNALQFRNASVIELGGADEGVGGVQSFTGRTTIRDAAVLLRESDLLIAHDSGLMHLALAVGTPVVALFGPTAPEIVVQEEPNLYAIESHRECSACWNRSQEMMEPGVCPRNIADCMAAITVDEVVLAAEDLALGNWKQCVSFF